MGPKDSEDRQAERGALSVVILMALVLVALGIGALVDMQGAPSLPAGAGFR